GLRALVPARVPHRPETVFELLVVLVPFDRLHRHRAHLKVALHRPCRQIRARNPSFARGTDSCRVSARTPVTRERARQASAGKLTGVSRRCALARLWLKRPRGGRDARYTNETMDAGCERARAAHERER